MNYVFDAIVVTPKGYFAEIKQYLIKLGISENKIKTVEEICQKYGKFYHKDFPEGDFLCSLCGNKVSAWKYIGYDYQIFQNRKIVGGSRRRGGCPICGGSDRERYELYILKKYTNIMQKMDFRILHFAPEYFLAKALKSIHGARYVSADIVPGRADVTADITNLMFPDETFDYIICNHVLEHITYEKKAFMGLRRCMKKGAILVLTVPICWEIKTCENESVKTVTDKIRYYGQSDHVRLYGNDIRERIENYGFCVKLFRCDKKVCNDNIIEKMGYLREDSVLLCSKI